MAADQSVQSKISNKLHILLEVLSHEYLENVKAKQTVCHTYRLFRA